jgi:hypothetical protein
MCIIASQRELQRIVGVVIRGNNTLNCIVCQQAQGGALSVSEWMKQAVTRVSSLAT